MHSQRVSLTSLNESPICWLNTLESARQPRINAVSFRFQVFRTPSFIGKRRLEFAFWSCATRTVILTTESSAAKESPLPLPPLVLPASSRTR